MRSQSTTPVVISQLYDVLGRQVVTNTEVVGKFNVSTGTVYQGNKPVLQFNMMEGEEFHIQSFTWMDERGEVIASQTTTTSDAAKPDPQELAATWHLNQLDGTEFTNTKSWMATEFAFAGNKRGTVNSDPITEIQTSTRSSHEGRYALFLESQDAATAWNYYRVTESTIGAVQVVGGAVEVVGGASLCVGTWFVGCVGGVFVAAHGLDNVIAGARTLATGEFTHTFVNQGATYLASGYMSEQNAQRVGMAVELVTGLGVGFADDLLRTSANMVKNGMARTAATQAAKMHALGRLGWQAGGAAGGAIVGGAYGGIDGALMGANIGSLAGGVAGFYKNKCFAAGEHVWTEHGSQPIETLRVGDLVLSRDEFDVEGELVAKRIEEVFVQSGEVFRLRVCGVSIGTTAEHPFYSLSRGWTAAGELEVGEFIATASGEWVAVEALEQTAEQATLYNFRIADFHTYFVGKRLDGVGVWAHNSYYGKIVDFRTRHGILDSIGVKYTVSYARQIRRSSGAIGVSPNLVDDVASVNSKYRIGKPLFEKLKQWFGFGGPVLSHAEHASIRRLWLKNGRKPLGEIELFTDRPLCPVPGGCLENLHRVLEKYGVTRATVIQGNKMGQRKFIGTPTQPFTIET